MKSLPVGIENFKDLIKDCYYIDKSKYIKDICSLPSSSSILFTRPRRFGKSLAISMLKTFFEKNEIDNPINYFQDLEIFKEKDIIQEYMGKYEVIHLNMKDIFGKTYNEIYEKTKDIVIEEIKRHRSILTNLDEIDTKDYNELIDFNMNESTFTRSIKKLGYLIEKSTGKRPILLVDEYDSPIQSAFKYDFFEDVIILFKRFYGETLKGNPYLKLSIITGITRSAKISLFSGINNIIVDTILDEHYDSFFGFTKEEIESLFSYFNKTLDINKIEKWYGNYKFGNSTLFNPWSIMCFLKSDYSYKTYWANTTSISIIELIITKNNISLIDEVNSILCEKPIISNVENNVNYEELNNNESLISFLLFMGYLTVYEKIDEITYRLIIPNTEIKKVFINEINDILKKKNYLSNAFEMKDYFLKGDFLNFEKCIENNILNSFSYFEIADERSYQVMLLTLFSVLLEDSIISSRVPAGTGRCDIMIAPKKENGFGAIIEVKYLKSKTSLSRMKISADDAMKQIIKNKYYDVIKDYNPGSIYIYGVCFSNKKIVTSSKRIL